MCCKSHGLSRLGLLCGLAALATLILAILNNSWLMMKEPLPLPKEVAGSASAGQQHNGEDRRWTMVTFKVGLWTVCPGVKRVEGIKFSVGTSTPCYSIRYSGWKEIKSRDLVIANYDSDFELALTPVFINRMRVCTVLSCAALVILGFGCMFALVGNCSNDNKTLVASGLFIFGGLLLGTGLMVFASVLSEIYLEVSQYNKESINGGLKYDYKYNWCFFTAIISFILTKLAAVCSLTGYLNRFSSIDEMVRLMVPGAERKMREHQRTLDYLDKQSLHNAQARLHGNHHAHHRGTASYDALSTTDDDLVQQHQHTRITGPLHEPTKTPPDLCTSNKCQTSSDTDSVNIALESTYDSNLAGQTVPITIKNQQGQNHVIQPPLQYANKYGTLPTNQTMFQGYLEVGQQQQQQQQQQLGASYNKHGVRGSATLQSNKKKCVKIETFQAADASSKSGGASGFCEFPATGTLSKKGISGGVNLMAYSGSAV